MAYINWCEMFSVGLPEIDKQHQKLVKIINEFHEALKEQRANDEVFGILNRLIKYTDEHFKDEERIMKRALYPQEHLDEHRRAHERLIVDIFALNERMEKVGIPCLFEIELFLCRWMIRHILMEDKAYQPYITRKKRL